MRRFSFLALVIALLMLTTSAWGLGTQKSAAQSYSYTGTTGTYQTWTANSLTSGKIFQLVADDDALNGGLYFQCLGGTSHNTNVFSIGEGGITTIAKTAAQATGNSLTLTGTAQTTGNLIYATIVDGTNTTGTYIKCYDGTNTDFSVGEGGAVAMLGALTLGTTGGATISPPASSSAVGIATTITAGAGNGTGYAGGATALTSGAGSNHTTGTAGAGGATSRTGGAGGAATSSGTGGAGGAATLVAGAGGATATGTAGVGGAVTVTAGTAGAGSGASTGAAGGAITATAGAGSAITTGTGGTGGAVSIAGGAGGSGSVAGGTGGALTLASGAAGSGGTGTVGAISIKQGATERIGVSTAGAVAVTGNTTITGTLTTTGAFTTPVLAQNTAISGATATAASTYFGKITTITTNGQVDVTLPANTQTAGSWMDFLILVDNAATVTFACTPVDTLYTANSLDSDAVTFATGHRIGAYVRFINTGANWVAINLGQTTMGVTDTD